MIIPEAAAPSCALATPRRRTVGAARTVQQRLGRAAEAAVVRRVAEVVRALLGMLEILQRCVQGRVFVEEVFELVDRGHLRGALFGPCVGRVLVLLVFGGFVASAHVVDVVGLGRNR